MIIDKPRKSVNLIVPAKEKREHLKYFLKNLLKVKNINKIIVVLEKKDSKFFFKHPKIVMINQRQSGYGSAIIEGFAVSNSDYGCIFNADGSFNEKDLTKMIDLTKKNHFVFASRYADGGDSKDDTLLTRIGNFIFTKLSFYFLNIRLTDILYTFVLCKTSSFKKLNLKRKDFRLCVELPFKVSISNYTYTSVASKENKRQYGKKKVNELIDGFLILTEIIKCFIVKNLKI
jgi:hypothetical protein